MAVDESRRTFGVERNEIDRRANVARGVILPSQAMFQKFAFKPAAAGRVGTSHSSRWQRSFHRVDRVVMQLVKFGRRATPVADIRLVPRLPVPGFHLCAAILLDAVLRPLINKFPPLGVILGRIGPARVDFIIPGLGRPFMLIRLGLSGKFPRHEADLNIRPHASLKIGVEDAVNDRPVVNGASLCVFAIGPG